MDEGNRIGLTAGITQESGAAHTTLMMFACSANGDVALTVSLDADLPKLEDAPTDPPAVLVSYEFRGKAIGVPPVEEAINMEMRADDRLLTAFGGARVVLDHSVRSDSVSVQVFGLRSTTTRFNLARARPMLAEFVTRCDSIRDG